MKGGVLSGLVHEPHVFGFVLHAVSAHCWGGAHQFRHSLRLLPAVQSVPTEQEAVLVGLSWSCFLE